MGGGKGCSVSSRAFVFLRGLLAFFGGLLAFLGALLALLGALLALLLRLACVSVFSVLINVCHPLLTPPPVVHTLPLPRRTGIPHLVFMGNTLVVASDTGVLELWHVQERDTEQQRAFDTSARCAGGGEGGAGVFFHPSLPMGRPPLRRVDAPTADSPAPARSRNHEAGRASPMDHAARRAKAGHRRSASTDMYR